MKTSFTPRRANDFVPASEERDAVVALAEFGVRFQINPKGYVFGVSIKNKVDPNCISWLRSFSELISFAVWEPYGSQSWFGDAELGMLRQLDRLKAISASNCRKITAKNIGGGGEQDKLRWLTLEKCPVDDEGVYQLSAMTRLLRLVIPEISASDESLRMLASLHNLRLLNLRNTLASTSTIGLLAKSLPKCKIKLPNGEELRAQNHFPN